MTEAEKKKMRAIAAKLSKPTPVELPSGAWRCQITVKGERVSIVDDDPRVAHTKALAVKAGLVEQKKKSKPGQSMTVGEMIDRYIEVNEDAFSPSTVRNYKELRRNNFNEIMDVDKDLLTQDMIQIAVNKESKKKGAKTVRNAHALLSAALGRYREDFHLNTVLPQLSAVEVVIPNEQEISVILDGCKGTDYELPIMLAMFMGLRASEIRGITWDAIDGDRLHIDKAIVRGDDGDAIKKPKTTSGDRIIRIPPEVLKLIEQQPKEDQYVVHMTQNAMRKGLDRICKKGNIRHFRFHDLRHVFASVSISVGTPIEYIRREMGHKTDNMIKNVYGHMMQSVRDEYADKRDEMFSRFAHENAHDKKEP